MLRRCVLYACLSRCFTLGLTGFVRGFFFPSVLHHTGTELFAAPQSSEEWSQTGTMSNILRGYLSWDAEYFVNYATLNNPYRSEHHHAFFPLYPLLIRWGGQLLFFFSKLFFGSSHLNRINPELSLGNWTENYPGEGMGVLIQYTALAGVLLSNIAAVFAAAGVYQFSIRCSQISRDTFGTPLTAEAKKSAKAQDDHTALLASLAFSFCPGSVFLSAVYTESVFAMLSFWAAVFLLDSSREGGNNSISKNLMLAVFCICLSTGVRSNGSVLLLPLLARTVICCPILTQLRFYPRKLLKTINVALVTRFILHWALAAVYAALGVVLTLGFMGFCLSLHCFEGDNPNSGLSEWWKLPPNHTVQHIVKKSVNFASLFVYTVISRLTGGGDPAPLARHAPEWCYRTVPNCYSSIQSRVWGVKFLDYWRMQKIDRFLASGATYLMCILVCLPGRWRPTPTHATFVPPASIGISKEKQPQQLTAKSPPATANLLKEEELKMTRRFRPGTSYIVKTFIFQTAFLSSIMLFVGNVEVINRIICGFPWFYHCLGALYYKMADNTQNSSKAQSSPLSLFEKNCLLIYGCGSKVCFLIGCFFFPKYLTWT